MGPVLIASVLISFAAPRSLAQQPSPAPDATLRVAVCPIVYPDDQTPGNKGIHYTFFGNAFFINSQGYLVTAAHVLQTFRDGGQPYILVDRPNAPPQTVKANIIGIDWTHDVAVLRAVPNPFEGKFRVAFLPLASKRAVSGDAIISTALHPANTRGAYTYQMPVQDWSRAEVLDYVQTHEEIQLPQTDLFIFTHEVQKGQSGAPSFFRYAWSSRPRRWPLAPPKSRLRRQQKFPKILRPHRCSSPYRLRARATPKIFGLLDFRSASPRCSSQITRESCKVIPPVPI